MTITELRILPPFAIARLGASEHPLENYDLESSDPLGFRQIVGAETLLVDRATGEITKSYKPDSIRFRDGAAIRPVAPFLEVFARTAPDVLEPLTLALLAQHGLAPADVKWRVQVGNLKMSRRTGDPADRILADVAFSDHAVHALEGRCDNFLAGKSLPLGSVQFIKPTASSFPEIRLRFTPAKGLVYGSGNQRKEVDDSGAVTEVPDPILGDRIIYDPAKGKWRGYFDGARPTPIKTNPPWTYAGYADPQTGTQVSWGYLDDACDGIVSVALTVGGATLGAFARIGAGPPTFAPDAVPIRTVADELEQALLGSAVADEAVTLEEAEEIIRRAVESVRLMNTAVLNGNTFEGRSNAQSTMVRWDTNNFRRHYAPIMAPTSVDSHAVLALHQQVLAALRSGTGAWFGAVLRQPEQVGDLSDLGRRKMPALMRGADGRCLTLTRRQIAMIVKAAVGSLFDGPKGGESA